ncbi:FAD-binding oxidoreductase [Vannielia litorea]|uniref:NAD(P)/FAD-dependent oxidoreductase n=1 Tax=Vannielia litorea TaxID=1217970 RepID=UPI001C95AB63|nr:FAD-dependent oxidoreductase [Vannielia litorea]MBY6153792.1 FAD-binding oxidoreductase [Vannielia litorea]
MARTEFIVIGAGTVGAAIAYGLLKQGRRVLVLEGGDRDFRAARANFGLVWVQGKGVNLPEYQAWTRDSSDAWPDFNAELAQRAGQALDYSRRGGLAFCLGEDELAQRTALVQRMHNQTCDTDTEMLTRAELQKLLPGMPLGPDVAGASFGPRDGHVNPLKLLAALHRAILNLGGKILFRSPVERIERRSAGYRLQGASEVWECDRLVVAAGLGTAALVRPLGLDLPLRSQRGQVLVTERVGTMLPYPASGLRQTAEGTMMIGATHENVGEHTGTTAEAAAKLSRRAARIAPQLANVRLVRQWAGLRVLSPDGGPIYTQSPDLPGLWTVSCHSGVTLAAAHADILAPALANGALPEAAKRFSEGRFDVQLSA